MRAQSVIGSGSEIAVARGASSDYVHSLMRSEQSATAALLLAAAVRLAGAEPLPGQPWRNSLGMEFVPIPGTRLLFCKWETRVQDYSAFVRSVGRKWPKPQIEQGPTHPAVNVTWEDARAFCAWLTAREQQVEFLPAGCRYRLPADLEWSVAVGGLGVETGKTPFARNGEVKGLYPWDGPWPPPAGAGNYAPVREVDTYQYTAPVGSFSTNRHGIFDLGGNVSEWCLDGWLQESFSAGPGDRTLRGGSWFHATPWHLASSAREKAEWNFADIRVGFRVVLELPAGEGEKKR
ncbi:MAG: formylglycine-generating enzyme family protein [Lentisphaerae bacterium]|nr:formylglycine-generating enzyme family protein [Lentisphaerota bacterium]